MTVPDIRRHAIEVGFDDCGVVVAYRHETDALFMDEWIAQGLHGKMDYLERNCAKRYDPRQLVAGGKTIVVVVLSYVKSGRDYHRAVKSKLYALEGRLCAEFGSAIISEDQHIFCDSAPFLERRWAVEAGMGQIGRNHQLIHTTLGSMVHLGELMLQVDVEGAIVRDIRQRDLLEQSPIPNGTMGYFTFSACVDCHLCSNACPTGALRATIWDARMCIAYTTHHCLVCQEVCPYGAQLAPEQKRLGR